MNLNSYLALMGKYWLEVRRPDGLYLEEAEPGNGALIPDTPYVITVDADSILFSDYAIRLMDVMERPCHQRLAVAQTPYSAFPDAPEVLERTAGATTDIQYFSHQGFTAYGATFWVGANALLRKAALDDICVVGRKGRMTIRRYIQDRTVIEDTESTVDLLQKGWQLFNYPERLAYSATPRDFGALTIQRGRWANGGLLILPKLVAHWWIESVDIACSGVPSTPLFDFAGDRAIVGALAHGYPVFAALGEHLGAADGVAILSCVRSRSVSCGVSRDSNPFRCLRAEHVPHPRTFTRSI